MAILIPLFNCNGYNSIYHKCSYNNKSSHICSSNWSNYTIQFVIPVQGLSPSLCVYVMMASQNSISFCFENYRFRLFHQVIKKRRRKSRRRGAPRAMKTNCSDLYNESHKITTFSRGLCVFISV